MKPTRKPAQHTIAYNETNHLNKYSTNYPQSNGKYDVKKKVRKIYSTIYVNILVCFFYDFLTYTLLNSLGNDVLHCYRRIDFTDSGISSPSYSQQKHALFARTNDNINENPANVFSAVVFTLLNALFNIRIPPNNLICKIQIVFMYNE